KLERKALSLFLQGREIKPYALLPSGKVVIIPYRSEHGEIRLLSENELESEFPRVLAYLTENKSYLQNREKGRMRGAGWYGYVYPKNIEVMKGVKILVPDIADRASFALDERGEYTFTSGYGITLKSGVTESVRYVLGLLNSKLLDFYLKSISTTLRGGFFRYFTQFIEQLPIRPINFSDAADKARHDEMVRKVDAMLEAKKKLVKAKSDKDKTYYENKCGALDRQIDRLVYDLYGLTEKEIQIVEQQK
ncbi:MAG TPA: TaqI-like C-terminal specificity domain-containing protein, partial [Terriglobia bacterium]|nr:TaqI-like C-terminal specificity domain-containing protein [Terriglobia bacterium]